MEDFADKVRETIKVLKSIDDDVLSVALFIFELCDDEEPDNKTCEKVYSMVSSAKKYNKGERIA